MDFNDFVNKVNNDKNDLRQTGFYHVKLTTNKEHTQQIIFKKEECSKCKRSSIQGILVIFKESERLTIFQAELLFALYILNKKPQDYASYHKCIAGKRFIENIEKIEVKK